MSLYVSHLTKLYGRQKAVNDISFSIEKGEIVGFLGPNGAGKSTTMKIATGYLPPTSGTVQVNGLDVTTHSLKVRKMMGYLPEHNPLYLDMFVHEYLHFVGKVFEISSTTLKTRIPEIIGLCGLGREQNKKIEELSKGMSQKIQFIATVVHKPSLIILDEPFSGLDPINSNLIKDEIIRLKNEGSSILFSTHRMEQVEEMCEEIVLMNKGKVVLNGHVNDIRNRFKENIYEIMTYEEIPESIYTSLKINNNKAKSIIIQLAENQKLNDILKYLKASSSLKRSCPISHKPIIVVKGVRIS